MKQKNTLLILVNLIVILSLLATGFGIFSDEGPGIFLYRSIRGEMVSIYGRGIYQHMSADVAIQGIAQDYVTVMVAVPLLLISCFSAMNGSLKSRLIMTGTLAYYLVTYLFYTTMGMYNQMFLIYVALLSLSFFAFILSLSSFEPPDLARFTNSAVPVKWFGGILILITASIAILWLSLILPPLFDGSLYPNGLEHYTTLIVQGLDLGLLLPMGMVSGILLIKKQLKGYLFGTIYFVFLSILMTALTAKVIMMAMHGINVIPAVIIIPSFNLLAVGCSFLLVKNLKAPGKIHERLGR